MALTKIKTSNLETSIDLTGINDTATSQILTVSDTGIDVTGTVTADVTRTSGANTNAFVLSDNVTGIQTSGFGTRIIGQSNNAVAVSAIGFEADGGTNNDTAISFYTQPGAHSLKRRMKLGLGGDISFYEDTGTTAKLFWDASEESLGIGTSSPNKTLDVDGQLRIRNSGATGYGLLEYGASATATNNWHVGSEGDGSFRFYNGNFGSGTERMRIDSAGRVTMPYQPAFHVGCNNGTMASNSDIVWDIVKTNNGGHYSSSTGRFTAPVTGVYHFGLFVMSLGVGTVDVALRKNGADTHHLVPYSSSTGGLHNQLAGTAVLHMNQGDYVHVHNNNTALYTHASGRHMGFSGHLIG